MAPRRRWAWVGAAVLTVMGVVLAVLPAAAAEGSPPVVRVLPRSTGRNVALLEAGASVVATSSQNSPSNSPAQMINFTTADSSWITATGQVTNQSAVIQLAGTTTWLVDRIRLMGRIDASTQRPKDFAVDVSTTTSDPAAFATVLTATAANSAALQEFALPDPAGARFVRLRVINNYGSTTNIGVEQFKVLTSQEGGPAVTFENRSTDPDTDIVSYLWDFGDGTSSTEASPVHIFPGPGTYSVTLTVDDAGGNTVTTTLSQRVLAPPTGSFTNTPLSPNEGQSSSFSSGMTDPDGGSIIAFSWAWGDGTAGSTTNPASHAFTDNNSFTVTLTTTDAQEQTASTTRTISVLNAAPTVAAGPDATLKWGHTWTPASTVSDPGTVDRASLRCDWDFGDGQTATVTNCNSTNADVSHIFSAPGTYTARLTVTDKDGASAADTVVLTVGRRDSFLNVYAVPGSAGAGRVDVVTKLFDRSNWDVPPAAGKAIALQLGDHTTTVTSDATGSASARLPLPSGGGTVTATLATDELYTTSTDSDAVSDGPPLSPGDIVFMVDESGSMGGDQAAVKTNLRFIADRLGASIDYQLGLVGFGGPAGHKAPTGFGHTHLALTDDVPAFSAALNELSTAGSFEPGYQAITHAMQDRLGYRANAGACGVLIGDEVPQGTTTQAQALAALQAQGAILLAIVDPGLGSAGYRDLATQSGGAWFSINDFRTNPQPVLTAILDKCVSQILDRPDLVVEITDGRSTIAAGDEATYAVTITNTGRQGATGVAASVAVPEGLEVLSVSDGGAATDGTVSWPLFDVGAGQSVVRTVTVRAASPMPEGVGEVVVNATAADDGTHGDDFTPPNNSASDTDRVVNALPVVGALADQEMDEGSLTDVAVAATDADGDALTLRLADGPAYATFVDNGDGTGRIRLAPPNDGEADLTVEACDAEACTTRTFHLSVGNVAPVADGLGPYAAPWGAGVAFSAVGTDVGPDDNAALTFEWDFDGDTVFDTAPSASPAAVHVYDGPGTRTAAVRVCDDDTCTVASVLVTIGLHATTLEANPSIAQVVPGVAVYFPELSASLTDATAGGPVAGRTVSFYAAGQLVCQAVTDASGRAACGGVVEQVQTTLALGYRAVFTGDDRYLGSTDDGPLAVVGTVRVI